VGGETLLKKSGEAQAETEKKGESLEWKYKITGPPFVKN